MRISVTAAVTVTAILAVLIAAADAFGSASTLAITDTTGTVCGILAGTTPRSIRCATFGVNRVFLLSPNVSIESVSGGRDFLCGLPFGGRSLLCWSSENGTSGTAIALRRVYNGPSILRGVSVGVDHVAAVESNGTGIGFWRGKRSFPSFVPGTFDSLTSGRGFSCGINPSGSVRCWGRRGDGIQRALANVSMSSIVAGDSHVCGINTVGLLICKGNNDSGQLDAPSGSAFEFSSPALGANHSCAIRQPNGTVLCWGGGASAGSGNYSPVNNTSFEFLVAGGNLTCGLTTVNFSVVCWGADRRNPSAAVLLLPRILPGICIRDQSSCRCGVYPDSTIHCSGDGVICNPCNDEPTPSILSPSQQPSPSVPPPPPSRVTSKSSLVYLIVGSVGVFAGVCSVLYCLWSDVCQQNKVHNSVQPTISAAGDGGSGAAHLRQVAGVPAILSPSASPQSKSLFRRQGSRAIKRQRSGSSRSNYSSFKAEEFTFSELAFATQNFSHENKIGSGSFGTVYKGKLSDGREVAIKRSESGPRTKKFQEKESAFQSELAFLSRLHHKHLVGLVGFCEESDERLLVYEFMKNGALYDHLHGGSGESPGAGVLNSWKLRMKILLDAARGIEYLHNYAMPPIIHRDIKSSNILLDANWVARVSDFGLSLMNPEGADAGEGEDQLFSMTAAGTVGYMDPEYYGLHHLTTKSDVYGLGVVMLEVLTGKRAIFKDEERGSPRSVVDYAVARIGAGELERVLDPRAAPPRAHEAEAVELLAYTAVHCVRLEGRERPSMSDVVGNIESALALCEDSPRSVSSGSIHSIE